MKAHRDEGFTLIELLVVMLVLGVLAGIAIPALAGQRQRAYATVMAGDLKAIVGAETAWLVENDAYTADPADLAAFGYKPSQKVAGHVRLLTPTHFVACTKHESSAYWLLFDSTTSMTTRSAIDCAGPIGT